MPTPLSQQEALLAMVGSLTLGELTQTAQVQPPDTTPTADSEGDPPPSTPLPEVEEDPLEEGKQFVLAAFAFPVELLRATLNASRHPFHGSMVRS